MLKVYLTKGLPASGKSTWAKGMIQSNPNNIKRINKDDLRSMLDDGKHSTDAEKFIIKTRDLLIMQALEQNKHVIVDDTNLAPKHEAHIAQLIKGKAELEIVDFTDVSVDECIKRDLKRPSSVGEKVIRNMHKQFLAKKEVYIEDKTLPRAILVDIDGTLAIMKDRSPYEWDKVGQDIVNNVIREILYGYDFTIILMSGRDESCRQQTEEWLFENDIFYLNLFMRETGNFEKDAIVKRRLFEKNIRGKYRIDYVLDDRNQVVDMWRSMGLTCLQVADGDF